MDAQSAQVFIGDVVQMRKVHPCGSDTWTVLRTGADVKIKCSGCGRVVMMDRFVFLKRRKKVLQVGSNEPKQVRSDMFL